MFFLLIFAFRRCDNYSLDPNDESLKRGGKVALGPKSHPIVEKLAELVTESFGYNVWYFNNVSELEATVKSENYGGIDPKTGRKKAVCLGVIFNQTDHTTAQYKYSFHYNLSSTPLYDDVRDIIDAQIIPYQDEDDIDYAQISSGLPLLINFIDQLILQEATSNKKARIKASIMRVPTPAYKRSDIFKNLSGQMGIFVSFPSCLLYLRFVYKILFEKEHGIQENLLNMGMSIYSYYFSWIMFYVTIAFLQAVIWSLLLTSLVFVNIYPFVVFSLYFFYSLFYICLGFFISSFFKNAKQGVLFALMILFVFFFGVVALVANESPSESFLIFVSISPMAALDRAAVILLLIQSNFKDFSFLMISQKIANYRFYYYYVSCGAHSVLWVLLGMWTDQIWPSEVGVVKHPLFCLGFKKKKKRNHTSNPTSTLVSSWLKFKI